MERMEGGGRGGLEAAGWTSPAAQGVPGLAGLHFGSSGYVEGASPGLSQEFLSSRSEHPGSVAVAGAMGRAGGMCLVLRAFLHCVFLAKWLLFLDPGSC